jgi:formimidoylglutamate deiminase
MSAATLRLPGFVNAHSHAFQRGMRGVVERVDPAHPHDDFWTWREEMYAAAGRLDPDSAHAVALLAYREMRAAGFVAVGEFHYVHHRPDGTPYEPANAMSLATAAAADEAGIDQVLLMTAYERAGAGLPPTPGQRRFCDPDVATYLARVEALAGDRPAGRVGLAPHSVRAVSRGWLEEIGRYAGAAGMVVHVHACEQRREIEECLAEHGRRPIELLADAGCLGPRTTIVHGTHASDAELDLLAEAGASVCLCPTTEANLGDGYLPALRLFERGIRVCVGTDSNTVIDPVVEVREVESVARRTAERRNVLVPDGDDGPTGYLLTVGSRFGAEALGLGSVADIELDLSHPSLAGVAERDAAAALIFGGSAAALRPTVKGTVPLTQEDR